MKHAGRGAVAWAAAVATLISCRDRPEAQSEAPPNRRPSLETRGGQAVLVIDSAVEHRIGIETVRLSRQGRAPELSLPAVVIPDPQAASIVRAPLAGRLLALDRHPWPHFGEPVAAGDSLGRVADALPLTAPRGGIVTRVFAQPPELVQAGLELLEITDFTHPLVRVTWQEDAPPRPPETLAIGSPDEEKVLAVARLIGQSPEADPVTRGPAYLYRIEGGWAAARPGQLLTARLPDPRAPRAGVFVPEDAVVQWEGLAWLYRREAPGRFVRLRVALDHPAAGGWLVPEGEVHPGDVVVRGGAGQLLSEEFRAGITVGDEAVP